MMMIQEIDIPLELVARVARQRKLPQSAGMGYMGKASLRAFETEIHFPLHIHSGSVNILIFGPPFMMLFVGERRDLVAWYPRRSITRGWA